ncbi:MAG: hypothetical protein ACRDRK_02770 [Pseudonocardia sp.]
MRHHTTAMAVRSGDDRDSRSRDVTGRQYPAGASPRSSSTSRPQVYDRHRRAMSWSGRIHFASRHRADGTAERSINDNVAFERVARRCGPLLADLRPTNAYSGKAVI